MKEGANINKSLSTLGRVIAALSDPKAKTKAPFRDSKLTHILKDALSGNSQTSMVAAVHGAALYFEETLSTLRYAASVKKIKTSATMNAEAAASRPVGKGDAGGEDGLARLHRHQKIVMAAGRLFLVCLNT